MKHLLFWLPEDTGEWILLILLWVLALLVTGFVGFLLLWACNFWLRPSETATGLITQTNFEEAHYSSEYNVALKMCVQTYHPDAFILTIEIEGMTDEIQVNEKTYIKYKAGYPARVKFTRGRIWRSINIKEIL